MSIVLVDEDHTAESRAFADTLRASNILRVSELPRAEAAELVRRGRTTAYVVLTSGFGEARRRMFYGDPPTVEIGVDPARRAEAGLLEGVLTKYAAEAMQRSFTDSKLMRSTLDNATAALDDSSGMPGPLRGALRDFLGAYDDYLVVSDSSAASAPGDGAGPMGRGFQPLAVRRVDQTVVRQGPSNSYAISFPQGIIWGIIGCAATFAVSLVTERRQGTLMRLLVAPIPRMGILAGKALACFFTTVAFSAVLFVLARVVFRVIPNSVVLAALSVLSIAAGFAGIMLGLSVLGRTERAASGITWAVLLMMSMTGGGMIPLFIMPSWMQTVSNVSPVKWAILALEGAMWRGFTPAEMMLPCGILLGVGFVAFVIGARAFRWSTSGSS
jgi:ABC-2 type transport system permease protein